MAYPYVSAAYGFKPVNLQGGRVYSGSTRQFYIAPSYGTNMFDGDIVQFNTAATFGTLISTGMSAASAPGTALGGQIGIFVGCEYSLPGGPIFGKNRYQYWPAGTTAQDALAYIVDDPLAVFRVAVLQQST